MYELAIEASSANCEPDGLDDRMRAWAPRVLLRGSSRSSSTVLIWGLKVLLPSRLGRNAERRRNRSTVVGLGFSPFTIQLLVLDLLPLVP